MENYQKIIDKIMSWNQLAKLRNIWAQENKTVVFTNGCFDIMHLGHIDYLSKAADLGNKLIIGVNSDLSVRKLKGNERPINPEKARLMLLSSLFFVDAVVLFNEDTPYNLISILKPDILVKGGDYQENEIAGADIVKSIGGKVVIMPLVKGFSTTSVIERTKNN